MKRRKGLTLDRHREIGATLKTIRDVLVTLSVELASAYPITSRQAKAANRAHAAVDRLRCVLDDALFAEHGLAEIDRPTRIYYPGTKERSAIR